MHEGGEQAMMMLILVMHLCLRPAVHDTSWLASDLAQNIAGSGVNQHTGGRVSWQKEFVAAGQRYLCQVTSDGLMVYRLTERERSFLYQYEPDYDFTHGEQDLVIAGFKNGHACVAWKWCKGHHCPFQNGAVIYDPENHRSFRLEYEEERGISLSQDLSNPENDEIRDWLISWWKQWPGRSVVMSETKISYKTFSK
jgi:hypothetical protein